MAITKLLPYSGKVWQRESLANSLVMSVWQGKVWRMHRFSHKVIIISKNLDGFSLGNYEQFAKFAKLSHYTVVFQLNPV